MFYMEDNLVSENDYGSSFGWNTKNQAEVIFEFSSTLKNK